MVTTSTDAQYHGRTSGGGPDARSNSRPDPQPEGFSLAFPSSLAKKQPVPAKMGPANFKTLVDGYSPRAPRSGHMIDGPGLFK